MQLLITKECFKNEIHISFGAFFIQVVNTGFQVSR
jgi:hypothetical protein